MKVVPNDIFKFGGERVNQFNIYEKQQWVVDAKHTLLVNSSNVILAKKGVVSIKKTI